MGGIEIKLISSTAAKAVLVLLAASAVSAGCSSCCHGAIIGNNFNSYFLYPSKGKKRSTDKEGSSQDSLQCHSNCILLDTLSIDSGTENLPYAERMEHLPPSAKRIYMVLGSCEALTQRDIIEETSLPSRTVRFALSRLKDENIVQEIFNIQDGRRSLYRLNSEFDDEAK